MAEAPSVDDVVLLAADRDIESAVSALLERYSRKRRVQITHKPYTHSGHDPAVFRRAQEFLHPFHKLYRYALVVFDVDGSGAGPKDRQQIETEVEQRLFANGWLGRAAAIAIDPEIENWVWSRSPMVPRVLGWTGGLDELRRWLENGGYLASNESKPNDPKRAFLEALRAVRKPKSPTLFRELAARASWDSCHDPAFRKLIQTLTQWFPQKS